MSAPADIVIDVSNLATPVVGRRERRRRETHEAIEAAAWRLFLRNGYDATTIDEIADAAGVAPRTFFRYFESKEEVLVGPWRERIAEAERVLRARPSGEPPLVAIANTVTALSDEFEADRPMLLQRRRLAEASPNVGQYQREVVEPEWINMATTVVAERLGVDPSTDVRPALFARTALAALTVTVEVWMETGSVRPFDDAFRETLGHLAEAAALASGE